jgi:hypothetical protein
MRSHPDQEMQGEALTRGNFHSSARLHEKVGAWYWNGKGTGAYEERAS